MKTLLAAAAIGGSFLLSHAANASCGTESSRALREMIAAKTTLATAVSHLPTQAAKNTTNRTVMTPLANAIRGLQTICNDTRTAPATRSTTRRSTTAPRTTAPRTKSPQ